MNIVTFIPPKLDRLDEQRGGLLVIFRFEERRPLVGVGTGCGLHRCSYFHQHDLLTYRS